jgi:hypothetical protein
VECDLWIGRNVATCGFVPGYARFEVISDIFAVQWRVCIDKSEYRVWKVGTAELFFSGSFLPSSAPPVRSVSFICKAQVKDIWSLYYFTFVLLTLPILNSELWLSTCTH